MSRLRKSGIGRAIKVLSRADQGKLIGTLILQILMAGLDLLGVLAIGLLGALSVNGMNSGSIGNRVSTALKILQIQSLTFQQQVTILGLSAVIFLVGRTLLSIFFSRKILFFLSLSCND